MPKKTKRLVKTTPVLALPGTVKEVSWKPPRLSFEDWLRCGKALLAVEGAVQWWLGDWWIYGQRAYGERAEAVADGLLGKRKLDTFISYGTVARAFTTPRRRGVLSFGHHHSVASLSQERQDFWLDLAIENDWSVNELRAAIAQSKATDRTQQVAFDASALGKFVLVLADPPWRYENPPMGGTNRSIENHYPTMELEEICDLAVEDIAHDNAILFLWATAPKLAECMTVITAWGFTYRTNLVWDKEEIGMGYHARNQHELLLIGKRGELAPPAPENRPASIFRAPRGEHSVKPVLAYEIIEAMYPDLAEQRIELFARAPRPGWAMWGNQLAEAAE